MSKSTTPRQPIAPKVEAQEKLTAFLGERKRAYTEAAFVAFCQNPNIVNEHTIASDVVGRAILYADMLVEALFLKPLEEEEAKKHNVPQGE